MAVTEIDPADDPDFAAARDHPGALRPQRSHRVESSGVGLSVVEWGDADDPPLVVAHGGFDFAGTYDVFAPLLAGAGWRVIAWDQRGHGDSDHAALYAWDADVRDAVAVLDWLGPDPVPLLGHSKGAGIVMQLAEALPHRVSMVVNLDGVPSRRPVPDVADHERTRLLADELAGWLDHRRRARTGQRRPDTIDGLARRRQRMNPRLPIEWLRYLVTVGGRRDGDGWRWKIDPAMRFGGFGPWRPEWNIPRMAGLAVPFLAVIGLQPETMGWGTKPRDVTGVLPPQAEFHALDDTGHFVHIEQPHRVAGLVTDFLGRNR